MKVAAAVNNGLVAQLQAQGVTVVQVGSADDVDRVVGEQPAALVLDERLPFAVELVTRIKAEVDGPDRDRVPVVAIGSAGHAIRCLADAYLPAEGPVAAEAVRVAKAIVLRRARQRRLFDQEAVFKLPTTPEDVERVGDMLEHLIGAAGYDAEDGAKLGMTLREAIGNAAEHGNKNDPSRTIDIKFFRSSDRVAFVVTDEGPGFDTGAFLARADSVSPLEHTRSRRATEARPGGLGVFIMKETCDGIAFNESGNSIFLMKYLPGQRPE